MIIKQAAIDWIPYDQGGRTNPPTGIGPPDYCTVIRFVDEPWPPIKTAWTLVIAKRASASNEFHWIADVRFLVDEAPHDGLSDGRVFELYEGGKLVARGKVIGDV